MVNYIFKIIKKFFVACVILYSFNLISPSKFVISINIFTLLIVTFFRFFGLLFLIILKLIM